MHAMAGEAGGASQGLDLTTFRNPGAEFRGVALWMLNDRIELGEATRQLRGFREAGWGAIITRTYMGTRISYLSPEWLELVDRIVQVSREQGTRVFLQESDTKVGGYVTTALLGMEDRFRHHRLVMAPADAHAPPRSTLLKTVAGCKYYDQTVAPPGESSQFFAVMDLLDEETVKAFVQRCHEAQAERYRADFGGTVEAIWMDEPFLRFRTYTRLPVLPWTPRLPELFSRDWGYSILDYLPSLFLEVGDFRRVRHHFWRTVVGQFKRAYWEPIGRWCGAHRVKFAGHLMGEDTVHDQIGWSGAIMPFYEDMQLPGIDYLTRDIATWRPVGSKFIITPKQCSSVANQLGKREVLSEMYGVSDQGLTFEDRKWIAEWLAALGINYRCYHAAFYSLRGCRKRMYPPHIGHQQPYWPENYRIADAMARLCYALRQGRYLADVLVLHPLESAHCMFDPVKQHPALEQMDQTLISLSDNLLAIHRGFDYGDEYLLSKYARAEGETLVVGEMQYRAVVLPGLITLRSSTVKLLEAFVEGRGLVLSVGDLPSRIDGVADRRIQSLNKRIVRVKNSPRALREQLERHLSPGLELTGTGTDQVWVHQRQAGSQRVIFLVNTSRSQRAQAEVRLRAAGKLEAWDLLDGGRTAIPQWRDGPDVCTEVSFEPTQSHLLVFHEGEPARDERPAKTVVTREVALGRSFRLTRRDPNALTLDFCRYRLGDGEWSDRLPVLGVLEKLTRQSYSGPVELQYRFLAQFRPARCEIVVEDSEQCRIAVNGAEVHRVGESYYWDRGFHRVNITAHVRVRENLVEVWRECRPPDPEAIRDHERFYGTDLESIYVIGDFAVQGKGLDDFALVPERAAVEGDLTRAGYPFFAGTIALVQDLELPKPEGGERAVLDLGTLAAAVATVRLNGREAGVVLWAPYRVDITELIHEGGNRVEIELTNALRNLLGPHHYTGPDKQQVWQTHFTAMMEHRDWMEPQYRGSLKTWSDAYQFAPFGISDQARVIYQQSIG